MIKVDKGTIEVNGDGFTLIGEAGMLIRTLYQKDILDDKDLERIVRAAKYSDKELEYRANKARKEVAKELGAKVEVLEELLKMLDEMKGNDNV